MTRLKLDPTFGLPGHPGQQVLHALQKRFPTQHEAAVAMGFSDSYLSDMLSGHRPLSVRMALQLEGSGIGTAEEWLTIQMHFELARERTALSKPAKRKARR